MQITIEAPDNIPLEKIEQIISEIKARFLTESELIISTQPRAIGLAKGKWDIPVSFFEPLPDDIIKTFNGYEE